MKTHFNKKRNMFLEKYLGHTLTLDVLGKVTQGFNQEFNTKYTSEDIQKQLEKLTELAGGSDSAIVVRNDGGKITKRHYYTSEEETWLLKQDLPECTDEESKKARADEFNKKYAGEKKES